MMERPTTSTVRNNHRAAILGPWWSRTPIKFVIVNTDVVEYSSSSLVIRHFGPENNGLWMEKYPSPIMFSETILESIALDGYSSSQHFTMWIFLIGWPCDDEGS